MDNKSGSSKVEQTINGKLSTPPSYFRRMFASSIAFLIFGKFLQNKTNAASLIAIMLVSTLCYLLIMNMAKIQDFQPVLTAVLHVIFVVIGYYFGTKQPNVSKGNEEED